MSFFRNMSFPRGVIVCCTLGSIALGVLVYMKHQRLSEVHRELDRVQGLVKEIQTAALRLDQLQQSAGNEKFKAQDEPETYIRAIAGEKVVSLGQVDITRSTKSPMRGIEDTIYKITLQTKSQRCSRQQIGNFLFRLEEASRRVKVTRIKMTPFTKVSPGEIGKDEWTFEADLTTRTKLDSGSGDQG